MGSSISEDKFETRDLTAGKKYVPPKPSKNKNMKFVPEDIIDLVISG